MVAYILKSQTQSSDSWPDVQTSHAHTSDCHRMNTGTVDPLIYVGVTCMRYTTYIFVTVVTLRIDFTVLPTTSSLQGTIEGIHQFRNVSQLL